MDFKRKEEIEQIRRKYGHQLSSHAFDSLWIWKEKMGLTLYQETDFFTVKSTVYGENAWFFPCGNKEKKKRFLQEQMQKQEVFTLFYLREEDLDFLEQEYPSCFQITEMPEGEEYLYSRQEFETLSGKRFSGFRKQIHRLERTHEMKAVLCDESNIADVEAVLGKHSGTGHKEGFAGLQDEGVAVRAWEYRKELGLFGVLVYVDQKPAAVAFGFPLADGILDGCLEKHDPEISGLAYYTQRAFLLLSDESFCLMNGEEDLGIAGLRMMKHHMVPVSKNKVWMAKYRAETKKGGN